MPTPAPWRFLVTEAFDGAENMALDAALHHVMEADIAAGAPSRPILRLYAWSPPAVSTGRHQALESACDVEACSREGVDVVQRPTGGRGVLHDDEITYAVIAPASGRFEGAGVTAASECIALALVRGLRKLGADVTAERGVAAGGAPSRRGACFASTSRCEVVALSRKLCGSAQLRGRASILQHGSLPVVFDADRQARLLGADPDVLRRKAVGLAECLGRVPETAEVHAALRAGFSEELGEMEAAGLRDDEAERWTSLASGLRADALRWRPARAIPEEASCTA